ncbi:hypothetical protein [Streptomyces sp. SYP-A7185]|uniref:hypothetical protein n=1 Tax=Streptomyces sp. SYP-A7185 TaxID=3040076 RepID=UPI0038F68177
MDEATRVRIEPVVSAAAYEVYGGEALLAVIREYRSQHRWVRWISNVVVAYLVWNAARWALVGPLARLEPWDLSDASVFTALALFLIVLPARRLLDRNEGRFDRVRATAVVCGVALACLLTRGWWIPSVLEITAHPAIQSWEIYAGRGVGGMQGSVMLSAMAMILFRLTVLLLLIEVGRAMLRNSMSTTRSSLSSAILLTSLLEIAALLELQVREASTVPHTNGGGSDVGSYGFMVSSRREQLLDRLNAVARHAEGIWYTAMRSRDRVANLEIRKVADGIAVSVRRWIPVAAVGGQELVQMRDAFTVAVVNAAEGEWGLLAGGVSARELLGKRVVKAVRRFLALLILAGAVVVVFVRPFSWTDNLGKAELAAPVMLAAVFLAGFADPTIYDRMSPVTKLGSDLLSKR